jgi:hypothetical protein
MEIVILCNENDCTFNQRSFESITEITPSRNAQTIHPTNICTHLHPNIQRYKAQPEISHGFIEDDSTIRTITICNSKNENKNKKI